MDFSQGILPVEIVDQIWRLTHNLEIKTVHNELAEVCPVYNHSIYADSLKVYATNYNIFKIVSGMGGLTYAN
jgi:hypothetical protein